MSQNIDHFRSYLNGSVSQSSKSSKSRLQALSHQNHRAAIQIQRMVRAHHCRLVLWDPTGGIVFVSRVVKIQRTYRGRLGRIKAAQAYLAKRNADGFKIKGLYYIWLLARKRLRKRLAAMNNCVTSLQRAYRMKKAYAVMSKLREIRNDRMARKVQTHLHRICASKKVWKYKRRFEMVRQHLLDFMIQTNGASRRNTASRKARRPDEVYVDPIKWIDPQVNMVDAILSNSLAMGQYQTAYELAVNYCQNTPAVLPPTSAIKNKEDKGEEVSDPHTLTLACNTEELTAAANQVRYASQTALMACWTKAGETRSVQIDYLEEAQLMMMQYELLQREEQRNQREIEKQKQREREQWERDNPLPTPRSKPSSPKRFSRPPSSAALLPLSSPSSSSSPSRSPSSSSSPSRSSSQVFKLFPGEHHGGDVLKDMNRSTIQPRYTIDVSSELNGTRGNSSFDEGRLVSFDDTTDFGFFEQEQEWSTSAAHLERVSSEKNARKAIADEWYFQASLSLKSISTYDQYLLMSDRLLYFAQLNLILHPINDTDEEGSLNTSIHHGDIRYYKDTRRLFDRAYRLLGRAKMLLAEESLNQQEIALKLDVCRNLLQDTHIVLLSGHNVSFAFGSQWREKVDIHVQKAMRNVNVSLSIDEEDGGNSLQDDREDSVMGASLAASQASRYLSKTDALRMKSSFLDVNVDICHCGNSIIMVKGSTTLRSILRSNPSTHAFLDRYDTGSQPEPEPEPEVRPAWMVQPKIKPKVRKGPTDYERLANVEGVAVHIENVTSLLDTVVALKPIILVQSEIEKLLPLVPEEDEVYMEEDDEEENDEDDDISLTSLKSSNAARRRSTDTPSTNPTKHQRTDDSVGPSEAPMMGTNSIGSDQAADGMSTSSAADGNSSSSSGGSSSSSTEGGIMHIASADSADSAGTDESSMHHRIRNDIPLTEEQLQEQRMKNLCRLAKMILSNTRLVCAPGRFMEPSFKYRLEQVKDVISKAPPFHSILASIPTTERTRGEFDDSHDSFDSQDIEEKNNENVYARPVKRDVSGDKITDPYTQALEAQKRELEWRGCLHPLTNMLSTFPVISFRLPMIDYGRRLEKEKNYIEHATRVLHRVYRGYRGRCRFRRVLQKRLEQDKQRIRSAEVRLLFSKFRLDRYKIVSIIQCRLRGCLWRAELLFMNRMVTKMQTQVRIMHAKKHRKAEVDRRLIGPPVVEMVTGRSCLVDGVRVSLKIYRCGNNSYKLVGLDLLASKQYNGSIYGEELDHLISNHNKDYMSDTTADKLARIGVWQHERVCELIILNLGLISQVNPVTAQLGANKLDTPLILVTRPTAKHKAKGLQEKGSRFALSHFKPHALDAQREQLGGSFQQRKNKKALAEFNREQAEKKEKRDREKKRRAELMMKAEEAKNDALSRGRELPN